MSRLITHTNILVDDFDYGKSFPKNTFIYFLTHFHADHYQGLSPLWDYGAIYCTHQTKKFILHKYPKIRNIFSYDYYTQNQLQLIKDKIKIKFILFDAKHIPGSAMIFFQGYMGNILFTGDFRYQFSMILQNSYFFPQQKRHNHIKSQLVQQMSSISLHVDQMIFDNTYCNKIFNFQTQQYIVQKMIKIIQNNKNKKIILIAMGALGKHKILMKLAEYFQTNIVVRQSQYQKIQVAGLRTDFLTLNENQGYIRLISKKKRKQIVEQTKKGPYGDSFICIDTDFLMLQHQSPDQINYIVPYSLHSNYHQMCIFIKLINPCILRKIVIPYLNFKQIKLRLNIDHRIKFSKYLQYLQKNLINSESGYSYLIKHYTTIYQLSQEYLRWFDMKKQKLLMKVLKLGDGKQNHNLRKRKPKLIDQQHLKQYFNFNSKLSQKSNSQSLKSLKSIADELNATNKNMTLQKCIEDGEKKKMQRIYEQKLIQYNSNSQKISKIQYFQQDCQQYQQSTQVVVGYQSFVQLDSRDYWKMKNQNNK